jgi:hypothetical protein
MNRFLSIKNLFLVAHLCAHSVLLAQSIRLPVIRQKGASLSPSVANEADHAIRLGVAWLRENPPLPTSTQTFALVQLALKSTTTSTNPVAWVIASGLSLSTNQASALLAASLASYPPKTCIPENLWRSGHVINRFSGGLLLRGTEVLDWRNDFAQLLICSQRKAPSGGGYWDETPSEKEPSTEAQMTARIRATAFGILALKEIHE